MTRARALIVDDERLARRELSFLLQNHPEIEVVGEAGSVKEAAQAVERLRPDLIFLDIQMPRENGFELFERTPVAAAVIFVTAHDEFALRAFEVNALDYLMKPVNPRRARITSSLPIRAREPSGLIWRWSGSKICRRAQSPKRSTQNP